MIMKVNSMLTLTLPKSFDKKKPVQIAEFIRKMLNEEVFPAIKERTEIDINIRVNTEDIRVAK